MIHMQETSLIVKKFIILETGTWLCLEFVEFIAHHSVQSLQATEE